MADQPNRDPAGRRPSSRADHTAVVLIGHGAPATDCPPDWVGELMSLEWRTTRPRHPGDSAHQSLDAGRGARARDSAPRASTQDPGHARGASLEARAAELDAKIRDWPRHAGNDPYKAGLERLADTLRPLLPTGLFAIGYNEFCRPSIAEAVDTVITHGARWVLVIPTMLTPGGIHSERDIPQALERVRWAHPDIHIDYLWPFNLDDVTALLAAHVTRAVRP